MKITDIKTFPLQAARDIFVVKVETDEGIYGLGEGGCSSREVFEPRASIATTAEHFSELRSKVDKTIPMGVEYHHRLSVAEAATLCQLVPPGYMAFLEEPIRDETPAAYAALRGMTGVPFAIGEEWSSKWQALPYIEQGLTNFCRVDVCNIGGLTEAMKVVGWSEAHYIDIMPHNPLGAVCTAATIHMCFAANNYAWVEVNPTINESAADVFPVQLERQGPAFPLPTRPGLGVEFDEIAAERHPHSMVDMPHFHEPDGSHTNW